MCQEETTMCTVTMEHRDLNHLLQAFQDATETLHSLNCVLAPVSSARRQKETLQDLSERRENVLLRISPSTQKENGQWNSADLAELSAVLRGEAKLAQQHVGPFVQNISVSVAILPLLPPGPLLGSVPQSLETFPLTDVYTWCCQNNLLRRMLANEDGDVGVSANEGREAASRLMVVSSYFPSSVLSYLPAVHSRRMQVSELLVRQEQLQIEKQARIDAESAAQRQEWVRHTTPTQLSHP
eukprot:368217-Rhodomonas_salina.6